MFEYRLMVPKALRLGKALAKRYRFCRWRPVRTKMSTGGFYFRMVTGVGSAKAATRGCSSIPFSFRGKEGSSRFGIWVIFPNPNQSRNSQIDKEKHRSNLEIGELSLFSAPVEYIDDSSIAWIWFFLATSHLIPRESVRAITTLTYVHALLIPSVICHFHTLFENTSGPSHLILSDFPSSLSLALFLLNREIPILSQDESQFSA